MGFRGAIVHSQDGFNIYKQHEQKVDTSSGAIECAISMLLALNFSREQITKFELIPFTPETFKDMNERDELKESDIYAGYVEDGDGGDDGEPTKVVNLCRFKRDKERIYNVRVA